VLGHHCFSRGWLAGWLAAKELQGRGWGQGGEMTQALYAHMNNKIIIIKKRSFRATRQAASQICLLNSLREMLSLVPRRGRSEEVELASVHTPLDEGRV
jgi:hypothetical protein